MKVWLAGAGLLLFFALPAILTMTPALPRATPVQEPVTVSADPESPPLRNLLTAEEKETVFMSMWYIVDEEYLYFDRRDVNWDAVRDRYLPVAMAAPNDSAFRQVLQRAVAALGDGHVSIQNDPLDWAQHLRTQRS